MSTGFFDAVLLGNMGRYYRVELAEDGAWLYRTMPAVCLTLTAVVIGFRIVHRHRTTNRDVRLSMWMVCGLMSIAWQCAWLQQRDGEPTFRLRTPSRLWDLGFILVQVWVATFFTLLIVMAYRAVRNQPPLIDEDGVARPFDQKTNAEGAIDRSEMPVKIAELASDGAITTGTDAFSHAFAVFGLLFVGFAIVFTCPLIWL